MRGLFFTFFCAAFITLPLRADEPGPDLDPAEVIVPRGPSAWHRFEIGPELFHYAYEEPGVMEMDGWLYGVDARYSWYHPRLRRIERPGDEPDDPPSIVVRREKIIVQVQGRYAQGETDYDGALMDGTPYTISGIDATTYEFRVLGGYAFSVTDTSYTAFFIGFGYRYKDDDASFDPAGYTRESTYRYVPLALRHHRESASGLQWTFSFEYDLFLSGEQVSDLRPFGGPQLKNTQNDGFGLRAAAALSGELGNVGWTVEPFVRYWDIDDSDIVIVRSAEGMGAFLEPENDTLELGVSVRLVF